MSEARLDDKSRSVVIGLYECLLHREPAEKELRYWVAKLVEEDFTRTYKSFIKSSEYRLKQGLVPGHPVGHYYSPVVDPSSIDKSILHEDLRDLDAAILNISLKSMRDFWIENIETISSATFPDLAADGRRYFFQNPVFSYADAIMLRAMLLLYRPGRVIEIGSGFSSAAMLDTADEARLTTEFTFIDPYPERLKKLLVEADSGRVTVIAERVQGVSIELFDSLEKNDILFIDSTHVIKTQSDVCWEFFSILPRLRPGVIIHFHDIFYPFEYPDAWIFDRRYSWNEVYGLRLFLMYNTSFKPLFFNHMFGTLESELVKSSCPAFLNNIGGSFWMTKHAG